MKNKLTKLVILTVALLISVKVKAQDAFISNPIGRANNIYELITVLLEFIVKLGSVVVVFFVIYSGFLFVKAQGDPGKISEAKSTFTYTVIGGVILLGARVIASVIQNTASQLGI